ncbi:hypothetical protein BC628DRAFT_1412125 [Trametes gibbosa]|nr:hypothetical protein BC628DRAFT_1412125 [Trametes gibbosa]
MDLHWTGRENGTVSAKAGAGVFFVEGHPCNRSIRLPPNMEQSNQTGEAVATLTAAQVADPAAPLLHITDSRTTLEAVTKRFRKYQDEGFICQKNPNLTRAIVATTLWVKGHNGHPANEKADALAGHGARKLAPDAVDVAIPGQLRITGAKLNKVTQKLAYKVICARKAAKVETSSRETQV